MRPNNDLKCPKCAYQNFKIKGGYYKPVKEDEKDGEKVRIMIIQCCKCRETFEL